MPTYWPQAERGEFADLDAVEEAGGYVGGVVFIDDFDVLLRQLSEDYLAAAWERVAPVLARHRVASGDLSWGHMHPGVTHVPGATPAAPHHFFGWTSRELAWFDKDPRCPRIDSELRQGRPGVACAFTYRSLKWRIAPDEYPSALRLIEALCTGDATEWAPRFALRNHPQSSAPWVRIAQSIAHGDQGRLGQAVTDAYRAYSPLGFRIVVRGYRFYLATLGSEAKVSLPPP